MTDKGPIAQAAKEFIQEPAPEMTLAERVQISANRAWLLERARTAAQKVHAFMGEGLEEVGAFAKVMRQPQFAGIDLLIRFGPPKAPARDLFKATYIEELTKLKKEDHAA